MELIQALRATLTDPDETVGDRTAQEWLLWAEELAKSADPVN